ncbi:MAG: HlyD family efflux transporter periplasmic adaptor subunit [Planctomycetales bacterium]|nr:HlyD family efflux transporter periplasmic adaptor subunit [Planctomycetales bacterium]
MADSEAVTINDGRWAAMLRSLAALADRTPDTSTADMCDQLGRCVQSGWSAESVGVWQRTDTEAPSELRAVAGAADDLVRAGDVAQREAIITRGLSDDAISLQPSPLALDRQLLVIPIVIHNQPAVVLAHLSRSLAPTEKMSLLLGAKVLRRQFSARSATVAAGDKHQAADIASLLKLYESLDWNTTTFNVVNEARELLQCDRVTLLCKRGSTFRVNGVSGQVQFEPRANVIKRLELLTTRVMAWGETFHVPTRETLPPQIDEPLQAYLDESPTRVMEIVPLLTQQGDQVTESRSHQQPWAALVIEGFRAPELIASSAQIQGLCEAAAVALQHADEYRHIFLRPLWKGLGNIALASRYRTMRRLVSLIVMVSLAALTFYPATYQVAARGAIEPQLQRVVYAPSGGVTSDVMVSHGDRVSQGDVLLQLENAELSARITEILGQIQIANQQISSVRSLRLGRETRDASAELGRMAGEEQRLERQLVSLQTQLELLRDQERELTVRSPIDGVVVTWDVERQLGTRPIERGQRLVTVADVAGPWQLRLRVADKHAGAIRQARQRQLADAKAQGQLAVAFVLGTDPRRIHRGQVSSISDAAQPNETRDTELQVTAAIDDPTLRTAAHVSAEVRATIACGQAPLGYVWFHEIVDYVYSRIILAFPHWDA